MSDPFENIINDVFRLIDNVSPDNLDKRLEMIAHNSNRKQSRICLHKKDSDTLHIMYICHLKGCKVKVHKHLEFPEWIIFLRGKSQIIYFDDNGNKLETIKINTKKSNGPVITFIPKDKFHTLKFSEDSFFLEVKLGPFNKKSTVYLE